MIKEFFPESSIGADIIAGFPGETHDEFMQTFNLLNELPITHFHVFPYSKRQNTSAAKMDNHIQADVKKERVKTLINLGENKLIEFTRKSIGQKSHVLFEQTKDGYFEGYTSHYLRVKVKSDTDLKNQIHSVYLSDIVGDKIAGEIYFN